MTDTLIIEATGFLVALIAVVAPIVRLNVNIARLNATLQAFEGNLNNHESTGGIMNIYIDESGSINRNLPAKKDFVIALVHPLDKDRLKTVHKRFVSTNFLRLQELDQSADGGKMFLNGDFRELKGSQFDPEMKHKFVDFFTRKKHFELFYIHIHNDRLNERYCSNTARAFNYALKLSLQFFIKWGYLPNEDCFLQIDE